ncbi:DUF6746 family protein [Halomonas piscis]|uniref:DUF6746 family protein n=1 Tax=Halomonas piscis TaxID=3031727 RepID=UPI0028A1E51E|nr:DUF6746 family protein [Halomonas piscis]
MKPFAMTLLAALLVTGTGTGTAAADDNDRPDHFDGKPAETLEAAVTNFSEGNQHLAELLEADTLGDEQLAEIHQLSYTLENALAKIDDEVEAMAESLEEVHVGSETGAPKQVADSGQTYLEAAQTLVP